MDSPIDIWAFEPLVPVELILDPDVTPITVEVGVFGDVGSIGTGVIISSFSFESSIDEYPFGLQPTIKDKLTKNTGLK